MNDELVKSIENYMDYLRNNLKLKVSFCNITNFFIPYITTLYFYNAHPLKYCECIKENKKSFEKCVLKQHKVKEIAGKRGILYGTCWAGIEEYVFPIKHNDLTLGFISVSGYKGKLGSHLDKIKNVHEEFKIPYETLIEKYNESTTNVIPNIEMLNSIITPLCIMFEKLYIDTPKEKNKITKEISLYEKVLEYLSINYLNNPSLENISKNLNYSVSYIRQVFKEKSKKTIGEYITTLKLNKAKELLSSTSLPIYLIASSCGFPDSNYFTSKFTKTIGVNPKEYRKTKQI